jgi:hypothetical protein
MKDNKIIKILIPVVALIVVFESVMLVSNLDKSNTKVDNLTEEVIGEEQTTEQKAVEEPVADFIWETDNLEMKVGKTYKITLNLLSKQDLMLDSVETHIYYDSKIVTVSKLETNKKIGEALKPTGIDNDKGSITAILWKDVGEAAYEVKDGEMTNVLSFVVTPKLEGKIDFDLSTSMTDGRLATIIVDSNTAKPLAYFSNKLEINVIK